MSFTLNSKISIGPFRFKGVHSIKISMSIHSIINSCNISIPLGGRLRMKGDELTESLPFKSSKAFNEGDKVLVQLGYNGKYNNEFEGFIRRISLSTPCEIECEGYVYQLRKPLTTKSFVNTTLKDLLKYIITGTDIVLAADIPDMNINKIIIKGQTGAEVLEVLKKEFSLYVFFHGTELFAGLAYTQYKGTVKHRLGWNVIKDNELKLREAKNVLLQINLIGVKQDGTKIVVKRGDNTNNIQKRKTHFITDEETLKKVADKMLADQKYNGYEGKITTLGLPFAQHGWKSIIEDPRYHDRDGQFLIDSMEVTYSTNGFRRKLGISVKVG
jgi:hypothetical protein